MKNFIANFITGFALFALLFLLCECAAYVPYDGEPTTYSKTMRYDK